MKKTANIKLWISLTLPAFLLTAIPNIAFGNTLPGIVPNAVGYLLLLCGPGRLRELSDQLADAVKRLSKMLLINLAFEVVHRYLQAFTAEQAEQANQYESPMLLLLASFVMLIFGWCFLLPAYTDLFAGMQALSERHGDSRHLKTLWGRTHGEWLVILSRIYVIATSLLACLPEASVLTGFEYDVENLSFNWYGFIGLFRTTALLLTLPITLLWLGTVFAFFIKLLCDSTWCKSVAALYEREILNNAPLLQMRRMRRSYLCFAIGGVFTLALQMDGKDLLPGFLCVICCIIGFLLAESELRTRALRCPALWITGSVSLFSGIAVHLLEARFLEEYFDIQAAFRSSGAYVRFMILGGLFIAEAIALLLFIGTVLLLLWGMVKRRFSVTYSGTDTAEISHHATQKLHHMLWKKILTAGILFALSAIGQATVAFVRLYFVSAWCISLVLSAAALLSFCLLLTALSEAENDRLSQTVLHSSHISAHTVPATSNDKRSVCKMQNHQNQNNQNKNNQNNHAQNNQNQNNQNQNNQNQNNQNNRAQNDQNDRRCR